jgi:hypothetical protein
VMSRLAVTIHDRLPLVPELAAQEFCGDPHLAELLAATMHPLTGDAEPATPPPARHR